MQDPQPALAKQQAEEVLQSTVVPFSLDKRPEGKRLIYSGRCRAPSYFETLMKFCGITCLHRLKRFLRKAGHELRNHGVPFGALSAWESLAVVWSAIAEHECVWLQVWEGQTDWSGGQERRH